MLDFQLFSGVTERRLGVADMPSAAPKQVPLLVPRVKNSIGDSLWAERASRVTDSLNRSATIANPDLTFPYEMWHSQIPPLTVPLFLKVFYYTVKRIRNNQQREA